jgi:integrase/recombinase XerD
MTLSDVVDEYVAHKCSLGMRFNTEVNILASFCRFLETGAEIDSISNDSVQAFLIGKKLSSYWQRKNTALSGLFRFALSYGYIKISPMPTLRPQIPPPLVPYIYSKKELKDLIGAVPAVCSNRTSFDAPALRNLILLLYGACLRISEALNLTMKDVCFDKAVLCIRDSKFYKTRMVPLGSDVNTAITGYAREYRHDKTESPDTSFFCDRNGHALSRAAIESAFRRLRIHSGVTRHDNARYQPRLHDLRHSGVVHRLIAWYQQGKDLQYLLPQLSTYLGHVDLSSTQRYLTMTPELLHEASLSFENYTLETNNE